MVPNPHPPHHVSEPPRTRSDTAEADCQDVPLLPPSPIFGVIFPVYVRSRGRRQVLVEGREKDLSLLVTDGGEYCGGSGSGRGVYSHPATNKVFWGREPCH